MTFCSEADPKGSDCYDQFSTMQECFSRYPTVYNKTGAEDDDESGENPLIPLEKPKDDVETVDQTEEKSEP